MLFKLDLVRIALIYNKLTESVSYLQLGLFLQTYNFPLYWKFFSAFYTFLTQFVTGKWCVIL